MAFKEKNYKDIEGLSKLVLQTAGEIEIRLLSF